MVYDREMGSMRILMVTPLPRWYLLICKLLAGTAVSMLQVYAFLLISLAFGIDIPLAGFATVVPALILSGLMLGAIGLLLSSTIKQLENFAGIMNFVIFPMFFMSSALYPLWKIQDSSVTLYQICSVNPFTYAVELIRFALYGRVNIEALVVTALALVLFLGLALYGYSPAKGIMRRKAGPGD
jgi:ABC-2 type transport system permease protein